jgi:hypothetical protein
MVALLLFTGRAWPEHEITFTFAWPVPSTVAVTVHSEADEGTSLLQYDLLLLRDKESGQLRLDFVDIRILELDGIALAEYPAPEEIAAFVAMAKAVPSLAIADDGAVDGVLGIEQAIDQMEESLPTLLDDPANQTVFETVMNFLRSPQGRQAMINEATQLWLDWVGDYRGLRITPGEKLTATAPMSLLGQPTRDQSNITMEVLGPDSTCATCQRLEKTLVQSGKAMANSMVEFLIQVFPVSSEEDVRDQIEDIERRRTVAVTTDSKTLQPWKVVVEEKIIVLGKNGQEAEQRKRHCYSFKWK